MSGLPGDRRKKETVVTLIPSKELAAMVAEYGSKAEVEEAKLDDSRKPLPVKLGEKLVAMNIRIPELIAAWSKRANEPISKMEFRQHVKKLLERPNVKEVDQLFESLDEECVLLIATHIQTPTRPPSPLFLS